MQQDERNLEDARDALGGQLHSSEVAAYFATFELNLDTQNWEWHQPAAVLFGVEAERSLADWERCVFPDDLPKIQDAVAIAAEAGSFYVEFRVKHPNGRLHWLAAKGQILSQPGAIGRSLRGVIYEITDRKALEARLLALNETWEARVAQVREEAGTLEIINRTGIAVAAEHNLERLVQMVTDAAVELSHAQFGAFFYNVINESGEAYMLYTLSGAPREAFSEFPMPRNTAVFDPTFKGQGPVRSDDILADRRYGKSEPYYGMPNGHLPVRSYLAVPVISRSGEVLGGLFFGHRQPGVFTERAERVVEALAAQAAVAIDNARLHDSRQREIEARKEAEEQLQKLNQNLERRVEERAQQLAISQTKLEDTERRFRLLVEGVTDYAIYMLDPSGNVINWNPGAERTKGYLRAEILGQHFSRFYTAEDQTNGLPGKALAIAEQSGKYETEG